MKRIEYAFFALVAVFALSCGGQAEKRETAIPGQNNEASTGDQAAPSTAEGGIGSDSSKARGGIGSDARENAVAASPAPEAEPAGAKMSMSKEELGEKALAMAKGFAKAIEANKGDCGAMAKAMIAIIEANTEVIAAGKAMQNDPEAQKWFEENYGAKFAAEMAATRPALEACENDPAMAEAFKKIQ